jgi:peptidoglycan L-alanyl-D-glutamate endopeptidase CwlK
MLLNEQSHALLDQVHPDLATVIRDAAEATSIEFVVTEGLRTLARQEALVAKGASRTLKSRHLNGHAVDLAVVVAGQLNWEFPRYTELSDIVLACARKRNIPVEWGGAWEGFRDGPHYQLSWEAYPIEGQDTAG